MPKPLSHIYKMYQFYENNWTQLYNKTILYKKLQVCIQVNTNKSKKTKTLQNVLFIEDLFLLDLEVHKTISNCLMLATISWEMHWFREYCHASPVSTVLCRPVNSPVYRLSWWWERH